MSDSCAVFLSVCLSVMRSNKSTSFERIFVAFEEILVSLPTRVIMNTSPKFFSQAFRLEAKFTNTCGRKIIFGNVLQ